VPDLHGIVENWASNGDVVYIESAEERSGAPFTMHSCDRIKLRDGKAVERFAYLDATPLVKTVALSPRSWPKFLQTQLRSLRRPA
jgi:ketosteroid isomerase-like protein